MIMNLIRRVIREDQGQSAILVAIFMTLLLGITAFTADAGFLFFQRRNMQNAADASALAGARELIDGDESNIQSVVTDYVAGHGIDANDIESVSVNGNRVTVELRGTRPLFFARVFGLSDTSVPASATAAAGNIISFGGGAPFAIPEDVWQDMQDGQMFDLYAKFSPGAGPGGQDLGPGNWGTINFIGPGSANQLIRDWLLNGYEGPVNIGDTVWTAPGVGLNTALDIIDFHITNKTELIIPIIDDSPGGSKPVNVVGFAAIVITARYSNNPSGQGLVELEAVLRDKNAPAITSGTISDDPIYDFGVKGVALVE